MTRAVPARRPGIVSAATLAGICLLAVAAIAAIYVVSRGTEVGARLDVRGLLTDYRGGELPAAHAAGERLVTTVDRGALVVAGLVISGIGWLRRRWGLGALALLAIGGANVCTQVLKPLLGDLDPLATDAARLLPAAFPSGHATVAMSVALGLVLVVPAASRPLAALLGAGYAAGMGVALLMLGWHYPSDIAAGYLMATAWAAAAGAVALRWEADAPAPSPARTGRAALLTALLAVGALAAAAVLGMAALVQRPDLLTLGRLHTTFVVASVALALVAVLLPSAVAAPLTRPRPG